MHIQRENVKQKISSQENTFDYQRDKMFSLPFYLS